MTALIGAEQPMIAIFIVTAFLAVAVPWPTLYVSLGWIMLCRPGHELLDTRVAGVTFTEIEALVILSLVAGGSLAFRSAGRGRPGRDHRWLVLVLAWPAWTMLRAALPILGSHAIPISPMVDLQLVESYVLIFPFAVIARLRGWNALVALIIRVALVACVIALVSWVLFNGRVIPAGEWSVVRNSGSAAADVRPGGELVVCIAAALILLGTKSLLGSGRAVMIALIIMELAVSKTLSLVLAVGTSVTSMLIAGWHGIQPAVKYGAVVLTMVILALSTGVVDPGGRYDLQGRVDDSSGQYRAEEANVMALVITENPATLVLGTGVGTDFWFSGEYINAVKRDTHSVLLNVAAKTGAIGVLLFVAPFLWAAVRAFRRGGQSGRAFAAAFLAVFVVSISVPWAWTISGMTAVLVLYAATSNAQLERPSERLPIPG